MKKLIFIQLCCVSIICKAQLNPIPFSFKMDSTFIKPLKDYTIKLNPVIQNSNVITLSLDNMPCLVTNKQINAPIPNPCFNKLFFHRSFIPNALIKKKQ